MADFYEEDEPIEKIHEAFQRGEKFVTTPPACEHVQGIVRVIKVSFPSDPPFGSSVDVWLHSHNCGRQVLASDPVLMPSSDTQVPA